MWMSDQVSDDDNIDYAVGLYLLIPESGSLHKQWYISDSYVICHVFFFNSIY